MKRLALLLLIALALPAHAEDDQAAQITVTGMPADGITPRQRRVPPQLSAAEASAYARIFRDIDAGRLSSAEAALANMPDTGLLTGSARAQLYLARSGNKVSAAALSGWLATNADLPQAPRIAQLAAARGATDLPLLPQPRELRAVSFTPRMAPQSARGGDGVRDAAMPAALRPLLAVDRNAEAEARWHEFGNDVSEPVRTEWAQRTAWSYYSAGDDAAAIRLGEIAAKGSGEWAALGGWVAGLAAFRSGNCEGAARNFEVVTKRFASDDLTAAGYYWGSRAEMACMRPQRVSSLLTRAAAYRTSFYALLAQRTLGLPFPFDWTEPDFITADWNHLKTLGGARRAAALVEVGQLGLADRELRYLASISEGTNYEPLLRLSARINLPATQYWLAHHPPLGLTPPVSARFPAPDWVPYRGWRVDQSLVYAHALQESNFITNATSRAGAKGLMQLMPGTARLVKNSFGDGTETAAPGDMTDPAFNIEMGQSYLENLRDMSYTQGLLPKVIAAYNAGPGSVQKWNTSLRDNGDPLLFIESIPFKETRHYVEVVMRNFWMYQLRAETPTTSIDALAQGLWPRFPGMPGATGIKLAPRPWTPPVAPTTPAPPLTPQQQTVANSNG